MRSTGMAPIWNAVLLHNFSPGHITRLNETRWIAQHVYLTGGTAMYKMFAERTASRIGFGPLSRHIYTRKGISYP